MLLRNLRKYTDTFNKESLMTNVYTEFTPIDELDEYLEVSDYVNSLNFVPDDYKDPEYMSWVIKDSDYD